MAVRAAIVLSALLSACGGGSSPDEVAGNSNRAPLAVADVAAQDGGELNIAVLANDRDPDGDALTLGAVSAAGNGTVVIDDNGTTASGDDFVRYTPASGYGGNDSFSYTISDPFGLTATALVTVQATSTAPVANSDDVSTAADTPVSIFVLANDSDPNGLTLNLVSVTTPVNGVALINDNGTPGDASDDYVDYGPNAGFSGSDSFSYTVNNGAESASATVNVIVGGSGSEGVSGDVTKGPIKSATIRLYRIDGKGLPVGSPVAQTASNAQGKWTVAVPLPREPLLVVSEGGQYTDETDSNPDPSLRRVIQLSATDQLEGVLPAADDYLSLNLYTNAMLVKSRSETVGNEFMGVYANNRTLMNQAMGFDPLTTVPTDPGNPNPAASEVSKQYALLLGGAANVANAVVQASTQNAVAFNVLAGFINDMQDCRLDGVNQDGNAQYLFLGAQQLMPTDINLNLEITRFRNNNFARYAGISASLDESVCGQSGAVPDTIAPVITLTGVNPLTLEGGGVYSDAGFTAIDDRDGDVTANVTVSGSIDTTAVGTQTLTFSVTDGAGNIGTATRTVNIIDTTAPVFTLLGTAPVTVLQDTSYVDSGATALDAVDGDLTADIVTVNPVDISTPGNYLVTYDVTDASGNVAAQLSRPVIVVDTTDPVITLNGNSPETVEAGTPYVDAGASAFDFPDGDLTAAIVTVNNVNTAVIGAYTVTYDVTDSSGNPAVQQVRTVNVTDSTTPLITLSGANPQIIEAPTAYTELGATASDSFDGDISGSIVIDASAVDTSTPGSYAVTYDVTDSNGNAAPTVTRSVIVQDTTAPVITLTGANPQTLEVNTAYSELGATASDSLDGDLTASIVIDTTGLDPTTPGSYTVTYNVTDSEGNAATQVTRTVNVVDTTAPVITLTGANPQVIEAPTAYTELGATASDNLDGDISASIVIDASAVDTTTPGSYVVTYDVMDAAGNAATQVTRTVTVADTTAPVITLTGANPQVIEAPTAYSELGATASDTVDGDITASIVIDASAVDTSTPGSYVVTYDVTDAAGNAATQLTRTVTVQDTTAPVITLTGANPQFIEAPNAYSELGATASDAVDGDISGSIVIDASAVDTSTPGSYVVTYDVMDAAGNAATQLTRTVTVQDTTAPVITLLGPNPQQVKQGNGYTELGATASDTFEGDLSASVIIDSSAVDTATLGTYPVTYDVTDSAGNPATQVVRSVEVVVSVPAPDTDSDAVPDYIEIATGGDPGTPSTNVVVVTPGLTNLDVIPIPPGPSPADPTYVLYESNAPVAPNNDWSLDFVGGCDNIVLWGSLDIDGDTVLENGAPTTEFRVASSRVMRIDGCSNFQMHNIAITGATSRAIQLEGGSDATLNNVWIYSNSDGGAGGGILVDDASLFLSDSVLSDQQANADGGAIKIKGALSACVIEHNIFSGNHANSEGGAIYLDNSTAACLIRNNLFTGNSSDLGGAIAANDANGSLIVNNTFAFNRADKTSGGAGGGFGLRSDAGGVPTLQDNIFWFNRDFFFAPSSYNDALLAGDPVTPAMSNYNLISQSPVGTGDVDITLTGPDWESGFYLNQASSPAVDSGSGPSSAVSLDSRFTDASGSSPDLGTVDRGYHYPLAYAGLADSYTEVLGTPDQVIIRDDLSRKLRIRPLRGGTSVGRGHYVIASIEGPDSNLVQLQSLTGIDPLGDGESIVLFDRGDGTYEGVAAATGTVGSQVNVPLRIYVDGVALPILFDIFRRPDD